MNFRPLAEVDGAFGVFGLLLVELKLSSLTPNFGKLAVLS